MLRKTIYWLQQAANHGDKEIQGMLALMYEHGRGVDQSDAKAFEWFNKAANQSDIVARYSLGMIYAESKGVAQDDTKAFEWTQNQLIKDVVAHQIWTVFKRSNAS
jgi:TPR repeat protein